MSNNRLAHLIYDNLRNLIKQNDKVSITNIGHNAYFRKQIKGIGNKILIGKGTSIADGFIRIVGNNNSIIFGERCSIGHNCSFWMEGDNIEIIIGNDCTFTLSVHINAQENGSKIVIGNDCMLSNHIIIRTSDSHPIFNIESKKRINCAKPIFIGNHVWIAPDSKIMKGCTIGDGAIIGSSTIVTKDVPSYSLAVGMPSKVVKTNIMWTRDKLF